MLGTEEGNEAQGHAGRGYGQGPPEAFRAVAETDGKYRDRQENCLGEQEAKLGVTFFFRAGNMMQPGCLKGAVSHPHGEKGHDQSNDQGRNGNFGIQEGFNFGSPLGFWDWGFQVGMTAAQSNFCGDQAIDMRSADRNQYFFTGGIFHRAVDWGLQWGVTYDWLHDQYYANVDMKQIRSDSSLLLPSGVHEIGYFGAYGMGGTNFVLLDRQLKYYIFMEPTDVFAFYYRRYFSGGGDGRIWGGFSGHGDGVIGAELRVPIGTSWALENRINYLIPKQGSGQGGSTQESYGVTIQLVWYPGQSARCVESHPYRPMLSVADNTLFMTDTFVPPGVP